MIYLQVIGVAADQASENSIGIYFENQAERLI